MMRYKQGVYWLMLVFGVIASGIASSQTDDGAPARTLAIDSGRFGRMDMEMLAWQRMAEVWSMRAEESLARHRMAGQMLSPPQRMADKPFAPEVLTPEVLTPSQMRPRIDMRQPGERTVFTAEEPVAVDIAFHPANDGAALDMETLKIVVLKGWFGKDITDTVRPYVQGNAIRVPKVDFMGYSGRFQFGISIEDNQRRGSQLWFTVTIQV